MPSYSAADIIGATLTAKQQVPILDSPYDNAQVIRTIAPGQPVGVVDTFFEPTTGRGSLYWGFYDSTGRAYYTRHHSGWYEVTNVYVPVDPTAGNWWDNLLPQGGTELGSSLSKLALMGVAIWAGIKYAPDLIRSLKK